MSMLWSLLKKKLESTNSGRRKRRGSMRRGRRQQRWNQLLRNSLSVDDFLVCKRQIPLRHLVTDRFEAGRSPATSWNLADHLAYYLRTSLWQVRGQIRIKVRASMKLPAVPQTNETISAASGPKFTILWEHVGETLLLNKFFFRLSIHALVAKI